MIRILTNRWFHMLVLFSMLVGAVYFSGSDHEIRQRLQYATFDNYNKMKEREPSDQVAIIDIDEQSLKALGQWPWPRNVMAQMVTALHDLGAKVIAFDVVFAEPDRTSPELIAKTLPDDELYSSAKSLLETMPNNDVLFAQAIKHAGNVVTGFTSAKANETRYPPYQTSAPTLLLKDKDVFLKKSFVAEGIAENMPIFSMAAAGNGSFMATPSDDGVIRSVAMLVNYNHQKDATNSDKLYPQLALEALRVSVNPKARLVIKPSSSKGAFDTNYEIKIGNAQIPIEGNSKMWVYYRKILPQEYISAASLFDVDSLSDLKSRIDGKIVFIGASAEGLRDIRTTPLQTFVPGVVVHVNVAEQILQGNYLKRPAVITGVEASIIAVAGLIIIALAPFINAIILGIGTVLLMTSMFVGSWLAFRDYGLLIDPVYPAVALSFLFLVSSLLSYVRSEFERRQVRQAFGLYIAPSFMEELTKNPDKLKLGGEVRDLTVMFSDIRNFTTISEHLSPEELIQLMNDFLTPMSDLVMNNRGTIDKYMGDAMMAFWNAPLDDEHHARHACLVALKMNDALVPINEGVRMRAEKEGREAVLLKAGIGINTGPCSVGNMGSRQRFAYSALGDAVNLASRLEGQTKIYGANIIVGEDTRALVPELAMLELDVIRVKGKEKPVRIFALLGDESMAQSADFKMWERAHNGVLAAYRAMDWNCCAQDIKDARAAAKGQLNALYDLYAARISDFIKTPPQKDWDGVYNVLEK
jgi:adenylate cyclase